jgi:hypothetical protein
LFEFEKLIVETLMLVPEAETTMLPWVEATVAVAVIVDPFRPNDMPFELLKTTLPRLPELAPAEKLTTGSDVAMDAVIIELVRPNVIPLPLLNVRADRFAEVAPALTLMFEIVAAFDCIAVVRNAGMFRESPELFTVHETPLAVNAVLRPTASFDARAVVR